MDLTHPLVDAAWRPKYLLSHTTLCEALLSSDAEGIGPASWELSPLNPKCRLESLDLAKTRWRVDGATAYGTCFFVMPLVADLLPPIRIFLRLPDQAGWPPALRISLDSSKSVSLREGSAISALGISHLICRLLDHKCATNPSFLTQYLGLPFASELVVENLSPCVADIRLTVAPNHEFEKRMTTLQGLHSLWPDVEALAWPPVVDVYTLHLARQVHDAISIVQAREFEGALVFKSPVSSLDHMYHELHFLLTVPPHPNIMPPPLAIVVKRTAFGGKQGVVGFLLPYFPAGSIRDILPVRQKDNCLSPQLKLKWCRQVASAMIHIHDVAGTFYSDLRPDNVLLDKDDNVVLCDFEQRGNWHEWNAPEILFRQYIDNIYRAAAGDADNLLADSTIQASKLGFGNHMSRVQAANRPWFLLSPAEQSKASAYTLGLFMYAVFEGLSGVRKNIANEYPIEPVIEFPTTQHTPENVLALIRRCTYDAIEWEESQRPCRPPRVVRAHGLLYPEGRMNIQAGTLETASQVLETAYTWWSHELGRAKDFLASDEWRSGSYGQDRPSLRDVVRALDEIRVDDITNLA